MNLYVMCRWSGWLMHTGTALTWTTSLGELEIKDGKNKIATYGNGCWQMVTPTIPTALAGT